MSSVAKHRTSIVPVRFMMVAAAVGLLVGLGEAASLYFVPRFPGMEGPDISYVVWFVAPLTDGLVFALGGLSFGAAAGSLPTETPRRTQVLVAVGLGAAGMYLAWALRLVPWRGGGVRSALAHPGPWVAFTLVFLAAMAVLRTRADGVAKFCNGQAEWSVRRLAVSLGAALVLALLGIVVHGATRLASSSSASAASLLPRSPNIVLITLDAVRADHLSSYGYGRLTTPNIDRLAQRGVLFENAIAASAWTVPAHASIFTGLLPHQHGAGWLASLDRHVWTLAGVLRSRGYETAGFTSNFHFAEGGWGLDEGFDLYDDDSSTVSHSLAATLIGEHFLQRLYEKVIRFDNFDRRNAREVNRDILAWLRRRSARPFLMFINYYDAHDPYQAPRPYSRRFGRTPEALLRRFNKNQMLPNGFSPQERALLVDGYDNGIAFLDEQVGRLVQFLDRTPRGSNTVIIITADHGEAFGEHGTYSHPWNLYWQAIHVPLILRGPGIPAGQRSAQVVSTVDLFSTVLDLTGFGDKRFGRTSLRRFWDEGNQAGRTDESAVSELVPPPPEYRPVMASLVTSQWHYIQDSAGRSSLFHWPTDPVEALDLSSSPQCAEILRSLHQRLFDRLAASVRPWRDTEYLLALDRPGYSALPDLALGVSLTPTTIRLGEPQSYFGQTRATVPPRIAPEDRDLIQSLPYHH